MYLQIFFIFNHIYLLFFILEMSDISFDLSMLIKTLINLTKKYLRYGKKIVLKI